MKHISLSHISLGCLIKHLLDSKEKTNIETVYGHGGQMEKLDTTQS